MSERFEEHLEDTEVMIAPYTAEQLEVRLSQFSEEVMDSEKILAARKSMPRDTFERLQDQIHQELVRQLTQESARFRHMFETTQGSRYFELFSGHSLRIKATDGKFGESSIQPMLKNVFFITPAAAEQMLEIGKKYESYNPLLGLSFESSSLVVGAMPVELNMLYNKPFDDTIIKYSERGVVLAAPVNQRSGQFHISGMHIGTQIVNILK